MTRTRFLGVLGFFALLGAGTAAAEGVREVYTFKITEDGVETIVQFDNREAGFSIRDLTPGETRVAPGSLGENVAISCIDDNYVVNVDGRVFNIPVTLQSVNNTLSEDDSDNGAPVARSPHTAQQPFVRPGNPAARFGDRDEPLLEITAEVSAPPPGADDGVYYLERLVVKKKKGKKKR